MPHDVFFVNGQTKRIFVEAFADELWESLFSNGPLAENPGIIMFIERRLGFYVQLEAADQLGNLRPANTLGDVGALEIQ